MWKGWVWFNYRAVPNLSRGLPTKMGNLFLLLLPVYLLHRSNKTMRGIAIMHCVFPYSSHWLVRLEKAIGFAVFPIKKKKNPLRFFLFCLYWNSGKLSIKQPRQNSLSLALPKFSRYSYSQHEAGTVPACHVAAKDEESVRKSRWQPQFSNTDMFDHIEINR